MWLLFFIQGEGGKWGAVLNSIRKVISYHETEGTGAVQVYGCAQLALIHAEWCGAPADFVRPYSAKDPKINCLQKHTQNLF